MQVDGNPALITILSTAVPPVRCNFAAGILDIRRTVAKRKARFFMCELRSCTLANPIVLSGSSSCPFTEPLALRASSGRFYHLNYFFAADSSDARALSLMRAIRIFTMPRSA